MRANTRKRFGETDGGSMRCEFAGRQPGSAPSPIPEKQDASTPAWEPRISVALLIFGAGWLATTAGLIEGIYYWPLALALGGAWLLVAGSACGIPMTVIGSLWLSQTVGLFEQAYFWPLVVIIVGALSVAAQFNERRRRQRDSRRL